MKNTLMLVLLVGTLWAAPAPASEAVNGGNPGQELDVKAQLRPGRTNIVDFFSKFCPPCMALSPLLDRLGEKRSDIQIVKVDVNRPGINGIDWSSPLVRQYRLESLPHFQIYDGRGKLLHEGDPAYKQIATWLKTEKLIN